MQRSRKLPSAITLMCNFRSGIRYILSYTTRKIILVSFLLTAGLVLYFWQGLPLGRQIFSKGRAFAQAEDLPEGELEFCVDAGKIYFFQPQTGRIFVYQTTTNRFSRLLTLEKLGEDLKRSRSLPVIEED